MIGRSVFFMAKYSYEFKKKDVQAYLNGEGGYTYLAGKFRIENAYLKELRRNLGG